MRTGCYASSSISSTRTGSGAPADLRCAVPRQALCTHRQSPEGQGLSRSGPSEHISEPDRSQQEGPGGSGAAVRRQCSRVTSGKSLAAPSLRVRACARVLVPMSACARVCTRAGARVCVCTRVPACWCPCLRVRACARVLVPVSVCARLHECVLPRVPVCEHVLVRVYGCASVCTRVLAHVSLRMRVCSVCASARTLCV